MDNSMQHKGQHTPGPWRVITAADENGLIIAAEKGRLTYFLSEVFFGFDLTFGPDRDEAESNARLIAAAPDLLEVLKEILDATAYDHGGPIDLYAKAEKIIAKSKGE